MKPDYPKDYSFLIHLGDVVFDVLSPSLILEKTGWEPKYPKGQGLADLAWYSDDVPAVAERMFEAGLGVVTQHGETIPPGPDLAARVKSGLTEDSRLIFARWEEVGIAYEFFDLGVSHREFYSRIGDPRLNPDWTLPPTSPDDPLGIVRARHHSVITRPGSRGLELYTDVLGGEVVHRGYDSRRDADSVFVKFAHSVIEFAAPRNGVVIDPRTNEAADRDICVGLTLQVASVERAARHLEAQGLTVLSDGDQIHTDPVETFGVEWVFSELAPFGDR